MAQSSRPRPWRHASGLRELFRLPSIEGQDWAPLEQYFNLHKAPSKVLEDEPWKGWEEEYSDDTIVRSLFDHYLSYT